MGILRADRVSGLGGANAINGSVSFSVHSWMNVEPHDDLTLGSGDFTIECWINVSQLVLYGSIFSYRPKSTNGVYLDIHYNSGWNLYVNSSYVISGGGASGTSTLNTWAHLALCKSGSSTKLFIEGAQVGSTYSDSNTYLAPTDGIAIAANGYNRNGASIVDGTYISNFRIIKGEALYTSAFTVPAQRLTKTANTVLLCCQSPGDVLKEETGKTITVKQSSTAVSFPKASRFAPDVGEDYGTTFEDNTKFDTKSYMVPPGGTTTQSNRGRGLLGGNNDGGAADYIQYITIQSQGNSVDFGNLTAARAKTSSYSSSTRGIWAGGEPTTNIIQYVTIATTGDATDFGDLTLARRFCTGTSSATRGLTAGGNESPPSSPYPSVNVIDYTTIASAGNATDFGDLSGVRSGAGALSNTTRAVFGGGYVNGNPAAAINIIEYVTIATTGNTSDFGDLTNTRRYLAGVSSNTRGVFGSGSTPAQNNTIDFITIATTGNATDFGDATIANEHRAGISNSIRGVWAGSGSPAAGNTIDYVTIATTGDAKDFGDTRTNMAYSAGCSDSHGGLS